MLNNAGTVLIDVDHVSKRYETASGEPGAAVLSDVSLQIRTGEIIALLGRSGCCGKSTLLRMIAGLSFPSEGTVSSEGQPLTGANEGAAMVFQSFALFPWLSVLDNVEIGLRAQGVALEETAQARVAGDRRYRP